MWRAVVIVLVLAGAAGARTLPERPAPGERPDFHLLASGSWLAFDLDPRGAEGAPDADREAWGGSFGVGWTWSERLRLEAQLGGWPAGAGASLVRATCGALVPVVGGLSALGSVGVVTLVFEDEETVEGFEVGAGAAWTTRLAGGLSLEGRYVYLRQRYFETDLDGVTIHPDGTAHLLGVGLILDL